MPTLTPQQQIDLKTWLKDTSQELPASLEDILKLKLKGKYGEGKISFVDNDILLLLQKHSHWVNKNGYIVISKTASKALNYSNKCELLHRLIVRAKKNEFVDHINRNTLDNRRDNLRFCSKQQNSFNCYPRAGVSKYKGVFFNSKTKSFTASIRLGKKQHHIGSFKTENEAALAYNKFAIELHGEFAYLNPVDGDIQIKFKYPKYIYKNTNGSYRFMITIKGVHHQKYFTKYKDAVAYRDKYLTENKIKQTKWLDKNKTKLTYI